MDKLSQGQIEMVRNFVHESRESLAQLKPAISELNNNKNDKNNLDAIFTSFNALNETAGFLKLNKIEEVSQATGNLLDLIRTGELALIIPDHVDILAESHDFIEETLQKVEKSYNDHSMKARAAELSARLEQMSSRAGKTVEPQGDQKTFADQFFDMEDTGFETTDEDKAAETRMAQEYSMTPRMIERFVLESDELLQEIESSLLEWLDSPDNMEIVSDMFRHFHSFKGNCGFFGYKDLEKLSHQVETLLEIIKSGRRVNKAGVAELLLQLKDVLRNRVAQISHEEKTNPDSLDSYIDLVDGLIKEITDRANAGDKKPEASGQTLPSKIGELLIRDGAVTASDISSALNIQSKPVGEVLVEMGLATPQAIEKALSTQENEQKNSSILQPEDEAQKPVIRNDIRVDIEKLDDLIDLIEELANAEQALVHNPDLKGPEMESFQRAARNISNIVRRLQTMAMKMRMAQVSGVFRRMRRLVHDLSIQFGKKVDLKLSGEETELDRMIIDALAEPLTHMVRNALDHGLETPEKRVAAGKPETGLLRISASHEKNEALITIEDDGRGLNREKIIAKAREMDLMEGDGSEMSDAAIYQFIFHHGFSTADRLSITSGRGIGMDAVKKKLEKLNCLIEIGSSPGGGSKFTLRIPHTVSVAKGD